MTDSDFIEVTQDVLDGATCRSLIARFEASDRIRRGATGGGVNTDLKDSWDLTLGGDPAWADAEAALNAAMLTGLLGYVRKYPYAVLGPLYLQMRDAQSGTLRLLDVETLVALDDRHLQMLIAKAFRPGNINLQKYLADRGGYPRWHCELYPDAGRPDVLNRTLLWTLYLNDDFAGGETEFYHQGRKIVPRVGSLLIAPAAFTHTHRGNMPRGGNKYIATSWVLFQRGDVVYANPGAAK